MRKGGQNMDAVYDLKDMLCEELEEYGKNDKLDVGGLEIIDKLAHAIKNLDKIIEKYEEDDYSGAYYDGSYDDGNMNRMNGTSRRMRRYSGARGRGGNAKRDSMGRYSRDGRMMAQELRELMDDAPNDSIKMEIQRIAQKVENM
jgi:hypothetical protein